MHKILLISCYFPPAGGIQVQRALSLARYLPQNGFKVFVVTARASVPTVDPGLVDLIPAGVQISRTWTLEPPFNIRKRIWSRLTVNTCSAKNGMVDKFRSFLTRKIKRLLCPDPQVLWYPFALRTASKLIRENDIQTIIATAPPFSVYLLVKELKRRFPHLCAIADVRDEWLKYFVREFGFRDNKDLLERAGEIETAAIQACDRVVAVSRASLDELRSRHPDQPQSKFVLIPNGYDPAVFAGFAPRSNKRRKILVTYTGTIYRPCCPKVYLDALDTLPRVACDYETRFIGRIAEEFDRRTFTNRRSAVYLIDFIPQKHVVELMEETDILLLPSHDLYAIPGKLFEYLATGKPILALCDPSSDVADIMRQTSAGWCVDPSDFSALRRTLEEIHLSHGKVTKEPNWEAIVRYSRPNLVASYAQTIWESAGAR